MSNKSFQIRQISNYFESTIKTLSSYSSSPDKYYTINHLKNSIEFILWSSFSNQIFNKINETSLSWILYEFISIYEENKGSEKTYEFLNKFSQNIQNEINDSFWLHFNSMVYRAYVLKENMIDTKNIYKDDVYIKPDNYIFDSEKEFKIIEELGEELSKNEKKYWKEQLPKLFLLLDRYTNIEKENQMNFIEKWFNQKHWWFKTAEAEFINYLISQNKLEEYNKNKLTGLFNINNDLRNNSVDIKTWEKINVRRMALILSWKVQWYDKTPRLVFCELLERIYWMSLDRIDLYWRQAEKYEEEFYFMVLDLLYKKSEKDNLEKAKFDKILKELNLISKEDKEEEIKSIKIKEISLYLSGKLPPYYWTSNIWRFRRKVLDLFPTIYDEKEFDFINTMYNNQKNSTSDAFYFWIIDDLYKELKDKKELKSNFIQLLLDLEIPKELYELKTLDMDIKEKLKNQIKNLEDIKRYSVKRNKHLSWVEETKQILSWIIWIDELKEAFDLIKYEFSQNFIPDEIKESKYLDGLEKANKILETIIWKVWNEKADNKKHWFVYNWNWPILFNNFKSMSKELIKKVNLSEEEIETRLKNVNKKFTLVRKDIKSFNSWINNFVTQIQERDWIVVDEQELKKALTLYELSSLKSLNEEEDNDEIEKNKLYFSFNHKKLDSSVTLESINKILDGIKSVISYYNDVEIFEGKEKLEILKEIALKEKVLNENDVKNKFELDEVVKYSCANDNLIYTGKVISYCFNKEDLSYEYVTTFSSNFVNERYRFIKEEELIK